MQITKFGVQALGGARGQFQSFSGAYFPIMYCTLKLGDRKLWANHICGLEVVKLLLWSTALCRLVVKSR